jgi:thioredoxin 1
MQALQQGELSEFIAKNEKCVVMFGATWCAPCKALKPKVIDLATKAGTLSKVAYADIDDLIEEVSSYRLKSVPTLIAFSGGQLVEISIGSKIENSMKEKIESL